MCWGSCCWTLEELLLELLLCAAGGDGGAALLEELLLCAGEAAAGRWKICCWSCVLLEVMGSCTAGGAAAVCSGSCCWTLVRELLRLKSCTWKSCKQKGTKIKMQMKWRN